MTFDVEYKVKSHTLGDEVVVKDKGIKSDRIRLLAEPDGTVPGYVEPGAAPAVVLNEHTGIHLKNAQLLNHTPFFLSHWFSFSSFFFFFLFQ